MNRIWHIVLVTFALLLAPLGVQVTNVGAQGSVVESPVAPKAPKPPVPPKANRSPGSGHGAGHGAGHGSTNTSRNGVNIRLDDFGGLSVKEISRQVAQEINKARIAVAQDQTLPADVRAVIVARLNKVNAVLSKRGIRLDTLSEDIHSAMDGVNQEMAALQKKYGKKYQWPNLLQSPNGINFRFDFDGNDDNTDDDDSDDDDDDDDQDSDDAEIDMDDVSDLGDDELADAVSSLSDLQLNKTQRDKIKQLRSDERTTSQASRGRMNAAAASLRAELNKPSPDVNVVNRLVDQVSAEQAIQQKAQLKAILGAKLLLGADQQKKVQAAAKKKKGK